MMKKKIIFILFILLVFAIPTVSAEDTADINNLTISEESIVVEDSPSLNYLDVGESEVSTQNEVFVSGSFTDLNDIISSSSSGDTISLSGDIIRQGSELTNGISISHDLTINGNGYTIDANHNGRIFNINADIILTLNNITLANANTASYGGVIFSSFNDITVEGNNVNFINNSADDGGAIAASMGNVAVSGDNINFINNRAVDTGGAIDSTYGSVGISGNNINFINNTADDGGAIYTIWEDVTISGDNISFISNTGSSSIYSSGITATNTIFLNNSPIEASSGNLNGNYWGSENPASLVSGGVSVDNWIVPVIGGSDVVIGEEYEYTISLVNSTDNSVVDASRLASIKVQISKPDGSSEELVLDDNTNDYTTDISSIGTVSVIDSVTGNELSSLDINTIIPGNTFTALNKTINGNTGDIINLEYDYYFDADYDSAFVEGIIINRNLTVNGNGYTLDANHSGRIFNVADSVTLTLNDITLANGYATEEGGAITIKDDVIAVIANSNFINNTAGKWGSAIYNEGNLTFVDNIVEYNDDVKAIYNNNYLDLNMKNFSDLQWAVDNVEGTIMLNDNIVKEDSEKEITIKKNSVVINGMGHSIDAMDDSRHFHISDSNLILANVSLINGKNSNGGSIYSRDSIIYASNVIFKNNAADNSGIVYVRDYAEFYGLNVTFIDNSVTNNGGAIYGCDYSVVMINNSFFNNNSFNNLGGAITISDNAHLSINNTIFSNNGDNNQGGVIYASDSAVLDVDNCTFVNNSAENYGGAITIKDDVIAVIANSNFINNSAAKFDSSIYNEGNLTVFNNTVISDNNSFIINGKDGIIYTPNLSIVLNETTVKFNDTIVIVVSLTDDVGNVIYNIDGINVTIGNDSFIAEFDENLGGYVLNYTASNVGVIDIVANFFDVVDKDNLTIEFNKAKPTISINGDTTFIENEKFDFTITLNPAINGKVTVIVSDNDSKIKEYNFTVTDGVVDYNFSDIKFSQGKYSLNVSFAGDELNEAASNIFTITIKNMLDLTVSADDIVYGNSLTITVSVSEKDATGTVDVTVDGKKHNIKLVNGAGSVAVSNLDAGNYRIIAIYNGDDKYGLASDTIEITVDKANSNINVDVDDIVYSEDAIIEIITNGAGNVDILINDEKYTTVFVDGSKAVNVSDLAIGEYEVTVVFAENDNYKKSQASTTFTVGKETSDINLNITFAGEDSIIINTTLANDATGNVTLTINGENITAELVNGSHVFNIENLEPGDYEITVYYSGDDKYDPLTVNTTFTVNSTIKLTAEDLVLYYHNGSVFEVLVTNKGEAVADANVTFTVNGVNYTRVTDENGIASITINLNSGNYEIITSYGNQTIKNNVTVLSTIKSDNLIKYFHNDSQFHTQILDGEGNPIENVTVTYNINGVFYNRTTDENGIATLNINLNPGKYIITINNTLNGEETSNNVTVLPTIKVENLTKYYRNESQFLITVVDNQGNLLANQSVSININGVFYTRTTNEEGIATLNINLNPGVYIATAEDPNNGLMMSSTVVVISTVNVDNLVKYYGNSSSLEIAVVNSHGNPLAGQDVSININGVFYNRTTNAEGIAILNINLNPGEYIATVQDLRTGLLMSCNIIVIPVLTASDVVMDYNDGSQYEVKVLDEHGNPVANETVTMNINGVFYNRTSDSDGIARLNINLNPGEYIITAYHETAYVSNRIIVN